jgi:DNA-binding XRE family transcriptional regulator
LTNWLSGSLILKSRLIFLICTRDCPIEIEQMAEKINRLKSVLVDKDISQKEFAEKLSLSQNTISRICTNETQPSLKLLRKMAVILDVEISDLLVPIKSKK